MEIIEKDRDEIEKKTERYLYEKGIGIISMTQAWLLFCVIW